MYGSRPSSYSHWQNINSSLSTTRIEASQYGSHHRQYHGGKRSLGEAPTSPLLKPEVCHFRRPPFFCLYFVRAHLHMAHKHPCSVSAFSHLSWSACTLVIWSSLHSKDTFRTCKEELSPDKQRECQHVSTDTVVRFTRCAHECHQ